MSLVYFPIRVSYRRSSEGDLEKGKTWSSSPHTHPVTDLVWISSCGQFFYLRLYALYLLQLLGQACVQLWERRTSFCKIPTSSRQRQRDFTQVPVCSCDCKLTPRGSSWLFLSPHITLVFPSLFLTLRMSGSSIRSKDSSLTKTGYWALTIEYS